MDTVAIQAARDCLQRARDALRALESASDFAATQSAWTDFLIMANRVYTKLEQGSKSRGASAAWFGRKRHERRKDDLLRYIKNARDTDEHGLSNVTEVRPGQKIEAWGGVEAVDGWTLRVTPETLANPKLSIGISPPQVILVEVINYGDRYQPPGDIIPVSVARKAIDRLEALIAEATALGAV